MCNRSEIHTVTFELHYKTALKIDASNFYCKITLVWLDSSLSVVIGLKTYTNICAIHNMTVELHYKLHSKLMPVIFTVK